MYASRNLFTSTQSRMNCNVAVMWRIPPPNSSIFRSVCHISSPWTWPFLSMQQALNQCLDTNILLSMVTAQWCVVVNPSVYTQSIFAMLKKALTRWRHHWLQRLTSNCSLLLIYWPQKDERPSQPSWLTYSGRFTHTRVLPSAVGRA